MERINRLSAFLFVVITCVSGVEGATKDIVGLAVAASISFLLLFIVVFFIGLSFSWSAWIKTWFRNRGKVKMPRAYFKKKEEAKNRLLSATISHASASVINGHPPAQSVDRVNGKGGSKRRSASWVQGWSQRSHNFSNVYEEQDMTLALGEEKDDEFKIETVLVDNEVLDVGPFKSVQPDEQPTKGDIYPEPYIYTTADKLPSVKEDNAAASPTFITQLEPEMLASNSTPGEMKESQVGPVIIQEAENISTFDGNLVRL
ncbi:uncharacterized protein LOC101852999 isoform X2 [Aplysia californica]|uniref:Uncharacterized protein LOC101852999 isoform X2 n=1 Tax=Aplysia californica TaxID=6500 RepID=A0ABM0ZZR8_APLCA|nr:uncharacterized protein LOC101852999 isoform X2 [Aplysia californica]